MVITEIVNIEGSDFTYNYSDDHFYIQKVGTDEIYVDAYDPIQFKDVRKYVETDQKLKPEDEPHNDDFELTDEVNS